MPRRARDDGRTGGHRAARANDNGRATRPRRPRPTLDDLAAAVLDDSTTQPRARTDTDHRAARPDHLDLRPISISARLAQTLTQPLLDDPDPDDPAAGPHAAQRRAGSRHRTPMRASTSRCHPPWILADPRPRSTDRRAGADRRSWVAHRSPRSPNPRCGRPRAGTGSRAVSAMPRGRRSPARRTCASPRPAIPTAGGGRTVRADRLLAACQRRPARPLPHRRARATRVADHRHDNRRLHRSASASPARGSVDREIGQPTLPVAESEAGTRSRSGGAGFRRWRWESESPRSLPSRSSSPSSDVRSAGVVNEPTRPLTASGNQPAVPRRSHGHHGGYPRSGRRRTPGPRGGNPQAGRRRTPGQVGGNLDRASADARSMRVGRDRRVSRTPPARSARTKPAADGRGQRRAVSRRAGAGGRRSITRSLRGGRPDSDRARRDRRRDTQLGGCVARRRGVGTGDRPMLGGGRLETVAAVEGELEVECEVVHGGAPG